MVRVTAWVDAGGWAGRVDDECRRSVSLVKVSVWATVTVAVVEELPKVTDCEVAESIVDGRPVRVVTVEV